MNKNDFLSHLKLRGINCSDAQYDELIKYMDSVLLTNEQFNLTAITNKEEFLEKMIFDSALASIGNDFTNKKVIDVGTGAGFPGMVLYILNPLMELTFLDSTQKKINYILSYGENNNYKYNGVSLRAEDFAKLHREEFDFATARAVAPLNILLELIVPMLKVGGTFIALKGPGYDEEIKACGKVFKKLNCHVQKVYEDSLPNCNDKRSIVYIIKDKPTQKKYPREYNEIKRLPL